MYENVNGVTIFGNGGHAKVIFDILRLAKIEEKIKLIVVKDSHATCENSVFFGISTINEDSFTVASLEGLGITHFIVAFGGVGSLSNRMSCYNLGVKNGLQPLSIFHENSIISELSNIGLGSQILCGSFINISAKIGNNTIINSGVIVEHDCKIGSGCHLAPGVVLGGGVSIGDSTFIGIGAKILNGISIGSNVVIGAGSVVTRDVGDFKKIYGVPATERK